MRKYKRESVFLVSCLLTIVLLYSGKYVIQEARKSAMLTASKASFRSIDGAINQVVMYGSSGYIGHSDINIQGNNRSDTYQWKKIANFSLMPGTYSFTGLTGVDPETVELQLDYPEGEGYRWLFQWNSDIQFTIVERKEIELYIRAFPGATVNVNAMPAVYRDKE